MVALKLLLNLTQQVFVQHHAPMNFKGATIFTTIAKEKLALRHIINVGNKEIIVTMQANEIGIKCLLILC